MLVVDTSSPVPVFEQLRVQLHDQIQRHALPPGTRLPTVRRLAADLGLAPNTVARTYRELERAGLVHTAGRRGTTVAEPSGTSSDDAGRSATEFVGRMRAVGLNPAETLSLVRRALDH